MPDMTHPKGVTAEVTQGWQNCRVGSCLRHEACMYTPCRAPRDVDALEAEIASLRQRLESAEGLRPMSEAPKDRTYIMAKFQQPDPEFSSHAWHGRTFVVRHEGYTDPSGYDMGWSLFPGYGGCPDQMFEGWMPLPQAFLQEQEKQNG